MFAKERITVQSCCESGSGYKDSDCVEGAHSSGYPVSIVQQSRLIQQMLLLAEETLTPTEDIINNVCRGDRAAASKLSYRKMRTRMETAGANTRPLLPHTLLELSEQLKTQDAATVATFIGHVVAEDGTVALIFTSDSFLALLNTSEELYVDGTFSVTPRVPPVAQLYSVHTRFKDTGIATVFVLCEVRTTALYRAIWERIVELAPGLSASLRFIMSDYERAAISAIRLQFPRAKIHGCWFHFNQAVLRKCRQLGLHHAPTNILSVAMSLPLVRHEHFWDGLTLIEEMADEINTDHPQIQMFVAYLQKTWYPLRKTVSINSCPL